jgi:3-oxoadipate enol-lactonase
VLPGRGEIFYRHHVHPDPNAPMLLLLHGWTASADLQFFSAYEALAAACSFVAVDHRGHGRGIRSAVPFRLEDAADDAAALLRHLGIGPVTTIGYSMGGPISLVLARRHPDLVASMLLEATALEWRDQRWERWRWKTVALLGPVLRSFAYPRALRRALAGLLGVDHAYHAYLPWLVGELRRTDAVAVVEAGRALGEYDARPWAAALGKPTAVLVTTHDHLVPPRKQYELARRLGARVYELPGDHLCTLKQPQDYAALSTRMVADLVPLSVHE